MLLTEVSGKFLAAIEGQDITYSGFIWSIEETTSEKPRTQCKHYSSLSTKTVSNTEKRVCAVSEGWSSPFLSRSKTTNRSSMSAEWLSPRSNRSQSFPDDTGSPTPGSPLSPRKQAIPNSGFLTYRGPNPALRMESTSTFSTSPVLNRTGRNNEFKNNLTLEKKTNCTLSTSRLEFVNIPVQQRETNQSNTFVEVQQVIIMNNSKDKYNFKVEIIATPGSEDKVEILATPSSGKLGKLDKKTAKNVVQIHFSVRAFCTTSVAGQISITLIPRQKSTTLFRKSSSTDVTQAGDRFLVKYSIESQLSTSIDYDEIEFLGEISRGAWGSVHRAKWREIEIAVKKLHIQELTPEQNEEVLREQNILRSLACPYIVTYMGSTQVIPRHVSKRTGPAVPICLLMEYCREGSLTKLLKSKRISERLKVKIMMDIAAGMSFLHKNRIYHRDLKPDNVLVVSPHENASVTVKITDFDTARYYYKRKTGENPEQDMYEPFGSFHSHSQVNLNDSLSSMDSRKGSNHHSSQSPERGLSKGLGTLEYKAPEVIEGEADYPDKADLYSFGVLAWQVWVQRVPYQDLPYKEWSPRQIEEFVTGGNRLEIPDNMHVKIADLIRCCWDQDKWKRPADGFPEVCHALQEVWKEMSEQRDGKKPDGSVTSMEGWAADISRDEAELLLSNCPVGTFLVRRSFNVDGYVLSYTSSGGIMHIRDIFPDSGKIKVIKSDQKVSMFDSLQDYINSMKKQKIIIQALDMRTYAAVARGRRHNQEMNWTGLTNLSNVLKGPLTFGGRPAQSAPSRDSYLGANTEEEGSSEKTLTDEEVLASLPPEIFQENLDVVELIFRSIPKDYGQESDDRKAEDGKKYVAHVDPSMLMDEAYLELQLKEKERCLDAINSKLSNKVMSNYNAFVKGMTQIHELGMDLEQSAAVCKDGRQSLARAKGELIQRVLVILAKNKKKQTFTKILNQLLEIKRILVIETQLKEELSEGNFPGAIALCLECRNLINNCKQFKCVGQLNSGLKQNYEEVQSRLQKSLAEVVRTFEPVSYEKILIGFRMSGQSHRVLEKTKMCFTEAVSSNTRDVVIAHLLMNPDNANKLEHLKPLQFAMLCSFMKDGNHFTSCLNTILEVLCDLMFSHYSSIQWHEKYQSIHPAPPANEDPSDQQADTSRTGLVEFKTALWEGMQRKVADILSAPAVKSFKIDEFLKILDSVYKFIDIGEQFSSKESHALRVSIKDISKTYFESYHKIRMEDLTIMLENEMWQKVPLQKGFSPKDMKDLRMYKTAPQMWQPSRYRRTANALSSNSSASENASIPVFAQFKTLGNPFSTTYKGASQQTYEDEYSSEEDVSDELMVDSVEEEDVSRMRAAKTTSNVEVVGPMMTTTTINVARFMGKYGQMMKILEPISFDIFQGIVQIVEYYLATIWLTFGQAEEDNIGLLDSKLRVALVKWAKTFIPPNEIIEPGVKRTGIRIPKLNAAVDINDANTLYGLAERTVALQSTLFIQDIFNYIRPHLQAYLPKSQDQHFIAFCNEMETIPAFIQYMNRYFSAQAMRWDEIIEQITRNTKWDPREMPEVPGANPYVYTIVREWNTFDAKMGIPKRVQQEIYQAAAKFTMEALVEGYCRIRKCTDPGRIQMNLDITTLRGELEKFVKPVPTDFAMNYIKAFYEPEDRIQKWCKDHPEYTFKQWMAIVTLGAGSNMKWATKDSLVKILTQMDQLRVRKDVM
ncbi:coiled-coil domain-containing protein [Planoprotostelium fungivorum]|uniref:Coiled-coil domain-containing protein n=1 Tax=Planoprotostelium fungivorum TaxID=1890364 RepID=A0A2P6NA83_9EUKA|nr:coiled-coil domain-containing protein [Planoprotostelium fungivorum]